MTIDSKIDNENDNSLFIKNWNKKWFYLSNKIFNIKININENNK